MTTPPTETTPQTETVAEVPIEMTGAQALWLLTRRFVIGSFAIVGAFAVGMFMIVGIAAVFSDDYDDRYWIEDPHWDEPLFEPVRVEPRPTFSNTQPASIEYRVDLWDDSIEVRADGVCGDDVEYSLIEREQEIRVSAIVDSRSFACSNSDWVTLRLGDQVGDRIVVNAEAGYTARPVVR